MDMFISKITFRAYINWMGGRTAIQPLFNSISVISGRESGDVKGCVQ